MAFIKFRADQLFDGYRMLNDQYVLVTSAEGVVQDIIPVADAGDDIQTFPGILSPGFINCHCHLELSHMKGAIPEKTGLIQFVSQVMKGRHYPENEMLEAIDKAEEEMINNGIVAVGDICNNNLTIPQKAKGRIWYHNFIEASGFIPAIAEQRFERAKEIYDRFSSKHLEGFPYSSLGIRVSNSIVPHAPYSVSEELWQKITHFPGNQLMTIHNQETEDENSWFLNKQGGFLKFYENFKMESSFFQPSGKNSLQTYLSKFLPHQSVILVHNVHTTEEDLAYCQQPFNNSSTIAQCQLYWCLCPNANLFISNTLPDIELFIRYNSTMVLGTDSLASNHQLNIVAEMQTIKQRFPFTKTEKLFEWATINGARALQMDNILGSFEKGKKPGIVLCETALSGSRRLL